MSLLGGILCLVLAGASGLRAMRSPQAVDAGRGGGGLVIEPNSRDFGTVGVGDVLQAEFVLTNRHNQPLHITEVTRSCSCAQPELGQADLQPGESTVVRIGWRPRGKAGFVREQVGVLYQVGGQPAIQPLTVSAEVRPDASYHPTELKFGAPDDPPAQTVRFRAERSGVEVRVTEVNSSTPAIRAEVAPDGGSVVVSYDIGGQVREGMEHVVLVRAIGFESEWLQIPVRITRPNVTR